MTQKTRIPHPRIAVIAAALACSIPALAASTEPAITEPAQAAASYAVPAPWHIELADRTLKAAMNRWALSAGWQLVWELPADYPLEARADFSGDFEDAVGALARSLEQSQAPMKAIFYRGNKVLRIVAKGAQ